MEQTFSIHSLEAVRRRVRLLSLVFGLGLAVACCIALLMLLITADYLLNLPALPRLCLMLAAAAAACYALWCWLIRPMLSRMTLSELAGRIEQTFPQYQDRLRSTVDILSGKELPGSTIMKQRIVAETDRLSQTLDLTRAVVARPVFYTSAGCMFALLCLSLLITVPQKTYVQIAFDRLIMPFSANPWPKHVLIDPVGSVPNRIPVGQRLDVNMRLSRGESTSRKAIIYYQYGDESGQHLGPVQQEYMTRGKDGVYHSSIDSRTSPGAEIGTLKVWMESGDDRKELAPIKVVQRLAIERVEAVITAPAYSKLPPTRVNLSQNPAVMTSGSKVALSVWFTKPLDATHPVVAEIMTTKAAPVFHWKPVDGGHVTATIDAAESFHFCLRATDTDGFSNSASEEYQFEVRPDRLPTVTIESPSRNEDRTAESTIPLQILAEDDFGIKSLVLAVDRLGDNTHWEMPLVRNAVGLSDTRWNHVDSNSEMQRYRADYSWVLSQLQKEKLRPGDVLEYYAVVKDNYELNGATHPPVAGNKLRISIISQEEFTNKAMDELSAAAEQAAALKQSQAATQHQTAELARETAGKLALDEADKAAAQRLAGQQGTIASQTKSLGQTLADLQTRIEQNKSTNQELVDTTKEVGDLLNHIAETSMKEAAGSLNNMSQAPESNDRDKQITDAQASQIAAGNDLQKALDRMGTVGSLSRSIENVQRLLEQQQALSSATADAGKTNLGKSRDELSPEDRSRLDSLAKQQAELANKSAQLLKQLTRDARKLSRSDPTASAAMSKAVDAAKDQDVSGEQTSAAKAMEQNQQVQAKTAQTQAEEGMQGMMNALHEAQQKKLAELAEKLADLQQQLTGLIREQAGHNLDNLNLQGTDVLLHLDQNVRADLFAEAERDMNVPIPAVELGMLNSLQTQTERNTREIAKTIPDQPDAADHLTEAADKMARALIQLGEGKVAQAYDPDQVDALAALLEAKKMIDVQKDAVDQQQEDQKKQSIRQAYSALLTQQKQLNSKTIELDSTPKNDDGSISRVAALQLSQLSFAQSKLGDTAAKMDADLLTLGSIVYSYANHNIVRDMTEAGNQLSKQSTNQATQTLQQQIVSELEMMIRDLTVKPKENKPDEKSKSASSSSGGAMSPPPPSMPSEAEFRLLKDMQSVLNDATAELSKQPHTDLSAMESIAKQQGDLRNLLDQLIHKASKGKLSLPPESRNLQLPEEAKSSATTQNDHPVPADSKDVNLIGDRMAHVRRRLSGGDAGQLTQLIQNGIIRNLDELIELSRTKAAPPQPPKPPKPTTQPKPKEKQQPSSGVQPDNSDNGTKQQKPSKASGQIPQGASGKPPEHGPDLTKQEDRMWGTVTPRQRDAVIESQSEKVLDKYKNLVDDYYRALSTKASEN
jgi:hypothetical protein